MDPSTQAVIPTLQFISGTELDAVLDSPAVKTMVQQTLEMKQQMQHTGASAPSDGKTVMKQQTTALQAGVRTNLSVRDIWTIVTDPVTTVIREFEKVLVGWRKDAKAALEKIQETFNKFDAAMYDQYYHPTN
jgi:hypothetical protein